MCINLRSICTCSFGVPQLQKRIVHGNVILHDDSQLDSVRDVQLVVLPPSCNTSELDAARFIGAVYHNDVWCMSGFLQRGHDPNRAATFRNERLTPIHAAVKAGHQQMVTMLLEAGARDVDHRALDAAATAGHLGILRLLLEAGGDAGRALQVACRAGRVEIVRRWSERPAAFYISTDVYRETLIEVSEAAVSTDNDFDILFFLLQGEVLCFLDPGWLVAVVAAVVKGGAFLVLFSAIRSRSRSLL